MKYRIFKYYKFPQISYFSIQCINIRSQSNRLQTKNVLYSWINIELYQWKKFYYKNSFFNYYMVITFLLFNLSRVNESFIFLHQLWIVSRYRDSAGSQKALHTYIRIIFQVIILDIFHFEIYVKKTFFFKLDFVTTTKLPVYEKAKNKFCENKKISGFSQFLDPLNTLTIETSPHELEIIIVASN